MKKIKMDKIAKRLGAERRGKISATGGYFGAAQLAEEVATRFQVPAGGGRSTDPSWDKKRLVPLASDTLKSLEKLAKEISRDGQVRVEPMQLAGLMLEKLVELVGVKDEDSKDLLEYLTARIAKARETDEKVSI